MWFPGKLVIYVQAKNVSTVNLININTININISRYNIRHITKKHTVGFLMFKDSLLDFIQLLTKASSKLTVAIRVSK